MIRTPSNKRLPFMPKLRADFQVWLESRLFVPPLRSTRRRLADATTIAVSERVLDLYLSGVAGYLSDIAAEVKTDSDGLDLLRELDKYMLLILHVLRDASARRNLENGLRNVLSLPPTERLYRYSQFEMPAPQTPSTGATN
jgi:hypothetical protein